MKSDNIQPEQQLILVINPGSTSTKIGVYDCERELFSRTVRHSSEELARFGSLTEQLGYRREAICAALADAGLDPADLAAVMSRGGLLKPIPSGIYAINQKMLEELGEGRYGSHASNLGALLAHELADGKIPIWIADPVVVDEMIPEARLTGFPEIQRRSIFHALNQKAIARCHAAEQNARYEDLNLIVAHLGGGISIGLHQKGQVVDVNNALDGEGPFSPERAGSIPSRDLIELCFSGEYRDGREVTRLITGKAGFVAWFETNEGLAVEQLAAAGDPRARLVLRSMAYQISKSIAALGAVVCGRVDGIVLTGGLAHSRTLTDYISEHVSFLAPVSIYAGEDELGALAASACAALRGLRPVQEYV